MAQVPYIASASATQMDAGFSAIRDELGLPAQFPDAVTAEAEAAGGGAWPQLDMRELPLVTLDPPGARDLDQALYLQRRGEGYRVWYAIADVPAFAPPGGAIDAESRRRGLTHYSPDRKTPLHPPAISEDKASLLAGVDRPAYLWRMDLDADGSLTFAEVRRAVVRNRGQLAYDKVQLELDAGRGDEQMSLLVEIGRLRQEQEAARGGVSLALPRQLVLHDDEGYRLATEMPDPVEGYNAQISLLTGMAAADIMLQAGVGILRVMPPASERDLARVRSVARSLGLQWPKEQSYPEFIRSLDPEAATTVPMLTACTMLMKGATYAQITPDIELTSHSAVAANYAHVTAPLRRLVDRYGLAAAAAVCAEEEIPEWVTVGMADLPEVMRTAGSVDRSLQRANIDLVEAGVLQGQEGAQFAAIGVSSRQGVGTVHVVEPAVIAECEGDVPLGAQVTVRLDEADLARRSVRFSRVD